MFDSNQFHKNGTDLFKHTHYCCKTHILSLSLSLSLSISLSVCLSVCLCQWACLYVMGVFLNLACPLLSLPSLSDLPTKIFHLSFCSPISFVRHICNFLAQMSFLSSPAFHVYLTLLQDLFATSLFLCGLLCVLRPVSL